jgi:hypothetical protein
MPYTIPEAGVGCRGIREEFFGALAAGGKPASPASLPTNGGPKAAPCTRTNQVQALGAEPGDLGKGTFAKPCPEEYLRQPGQALPSPGLRPKEPFAFVDVDLVHYFDVYTRDRRPVRHRQSGDGSRVLAYTDPNQKGTH